MSKSYASTCINLTIMLREKKEFTQYENRWCENMQNKMIYYLGTQT